MHHKLTFSDLYVDGVDCVGHNDDDNCASNDDWKFTNKVKHEEDVKLISDMNIDNGEFKDTRDLGKEDKIHLDNNIANEENQGNHFSAGQHKDQQNNFGDD